MPKSDGAVAWAQWCMVLSAGLLGAWLGGFIFFTWSLPREADAAISDADAVVVLTGERERLVEAMALLRRGKGGRLLVSGVGPGIDKADLRRVLGFSNDAGSDDVFACCVDVGQQAKDTVGNAAEIAAWADQYSYRSLHVVTAGYHMPRALTEIRRRAADLRLIPHPVFPKALVQEKWWANPGTARTLVAEYNKFVVSFMRAQLTSVPRRKEPA